MTVEELIKHAEAKREEAFSNGTVNDLAYWSGYIDALKAVQKVIERGE